jgi:2-polyprenyl-3-methyl-5-hydroxy-6-metoxy-1,4-benzoquinol methylase
MMDLTLAFPQPPASDAIEERYASRQSRLLLARSAPGCPAITFHPDESAAAVAARASTELLLVLTDPLLVAPPTAVERLRSTLQRSGAAAAVPTLNESTNPAQRTPVDEPYLTLRQLERASGTSAGHEMVEWDGSDPGLFLCRRAEIAGRRVPIGAVLEGHRVAVARDVFCHRFFSLRGQLRSDLLDRVPLDARAILEFGCGEGALGSALRARQPCRVVGIEMDGDAARVAAQRLDAVHRGDVRELVDTIEEDFDWIVGGDILEHLDDPWTFLSRLKRLARPGAFLLLSVPNIASWPIIADLLAGRFDYIYMGITCAGHLRFFTRRSIEEMLAMSGWASVRIEPQPQFVTSEFEDLRRRLDGAGIDWSEELLTPGYYVLARAEG